MKNKKGFTLMEMMVVVLILAGLAAIAYPNYSKVIMKSRVAEAISLGEIVREAQQRNLAVNGSYFSEFTAAHVTGNTRLIKSGGVTVNGDGQLKKDNYTVTLLQDDNSTNSDPQGSCIKVDYNKGGNGNIFSVYMLVEADKIGCTQAAGITNVCETIPSVEIGSLECRGY